MKQIKTLSNSFVLQEVDGNGKVLQEYGFRKGGLSYLIKNNNVKFYLTEDYFYKNVVWSADAPLTIDGISYGIDALPNALKSIFINEGGGGDMSDYYTKEQTNTLLANYYTKLEANGLIGGYADVENTTLILNKNNVI